MIKYITLKILSVFDFFHQRKIISFLKKKNINEFSIFFDVGAHKGESINLFAKYFKIKDIYSFEASPINFKILFNKINDYKKRFNGLNLVIENYAIGSVITKVKLKQLSESSSSTIKDLNENSEYFRNKKILLQESKNVNFFTEIEIDQVTLSEYAKEKNINFVDFIKIDTEGYEFEVLKGLEQEIKKIKFIYFEHHYDNMIKKNYKYSDIHHFLKINGFQKVYKIKMPLRKSFDYIYKKTI